MTKLTTELLEKFVSDIKTDGMCEITDSQVESALIKLLAYEQAADRPVGEIFRCSGNKTLRWWNDVPEGTVLYAAPVLPKQPELVDLSQQVEILNRILNWILKELPVPTQKASAMAIRLSSVIDVISDLEIPAPAQPVIPEQRQMVPDERPADSSNGNDAEAWFDEGWNACRAEMLKAQPVRLTYKLKDAVADIRNSGVEIDADKIKAERDTLNSPVIPDGWKLVPIEPTPKMLVAAMGMFTAEELAEAWGDMIEAAPARESESD